MSDAFQAWLESNDCYALLLHCSAQVLARARKRAISLEKIFEDAVTDGLNDLTHVVAHEMWQFLKEKHGLVVDRATDKLVHGDMSGFMEALIGSFLDHCRDKRRTVTVDPVYAYYRSLRSALSSHSKSGGVNFQPTRRGTFYAFSSDKSLQQLPYTYWGQLYHDWPQPPYSEPEIYSNPAIVELARFFWIETLDRFPEAYLLPIKELSRFLNSKYRIGCTIENESSGALSVPGDDSASRTFDEVTVSAGCMDDCLGYNARQNPRIDMDVIEAELEELARDCLAALSEKERIVLCRTEAGVKMEDIAAELDMKRASNVSHYKDKAHEKLKRTWSLWGPASVKMLSEVDKQELFIFYDKVVELCNNADHCREDSRGVQQ